MPIDAIPKAVGMLFAVISMVVLIVLFKKGKMSRKIGLFFLVVSVLLGFLIFSPMIPVQLQRLFLGDAAGLGAPLPLAVGLILLLLVVAFFFGRVFCGYLCPIGAGQELLYRIPSKKLGVPAKAARYVHIGVFALTILLAVILSVSVLDILGVEAFFTLNVASVSFYVFLAILVSSVFIFRPFCRLACPMGLLFSAASWFGINRIRTTDGCKGCRACERACPSKQPILEGRQDECYLCLRCDDACRFDAVTYGKEGKR